MTILSEIFSNIGKDIKKSMQRNAREKEELRREKFQQKIEKRVKDRAPNTPLQRSRDQRELKKQQTADKFNDRTMTRDEFTALRQKSRQQKRAPTTRLIPLGQTDEMKVKQMLRRLNPRQVQDLSNHMMSLATTVFSSSDKQRLNRAHASVRGDTPNRTFESIGTLKDNLLIEAPIRPDVEASDRALETLKKWSTQLSKYPGKFGSMMMLMLGSVDFNTEAKRREFQQAIEQEFGQRYFSKATNPKRKKRIRVPAQQ